MLTTKPERNMLSEISQSQKRNSACLLLSKEPGVVRCMVQREWRLLELAKEEAG